MHHRDRTRVDLALHDPSGVYENPMQVVDDDDLGPADKKRILDSWHTDAILLGEAEAEAENMGGGERARLREVMLALAELARRGTAAG